MSNINKVISLIKQYDNNKVDILIPCRIINCIIPKISKTSYIFEETILKLVDIGINSPEHIAETLCLDNEFVLYILNILKERKLINENYIITEDGKLCISKYEQKEENNNTHDIEYIYIGFIQNLLDGELCDYIVGEKIETYICYNNKSIIKENNRKFKIEHVFEREKIIPEPEENKYKNIILINKKYNNLLPDLGGKEQLSYIPTIHNIDIDVESKDIVYLHCQVEYIKNKIYVSDGYGSVAEEYIRHLDDEWIENYIKKQKTNEIYTQPIKFEKYNVIERYVEKINDHKNSKIDNKKLFDGIYCKHVYSLIENILDKILEDNHYFNKNIEIYQSDNITEKCEKIGFIVPENFEFKFYKLNSNGNSFNNLITYITLFAEETNNEKIKKLAKEHPNFILGMYELKPYRDNEAHGKKNKKEMSNILKEFIDKENIFRIVKLLLPDFEVNNNDGNAIIQIEEKLRNAIIDLRLELGNNLYERLPENIRDNIIKVFLDGDDVINNIYSSYQQMLVYIISNYNLFNDNIVKKQVLEQFDNINSESSLLLNNTSEEYIINAANNSNSTLNGCLIVFMYMKKYDEINKFFKDNPDFVNDVASIIGERKHGNKLKNNNNIEEYRNKLLKYIKYFIGEMYV